MHFGSFERVGYFFFFFSFPFSWPTKGQKAVLFGFYLTCLFFVFFTTIFSVAFFVTSAMDWQMPLVVKKM